MSYWTGLLNVLSNIGGVVVLAMTFSSLTNACLITMWNYELSADANVGVSVAVLFVWAVCSCVRIDSIGWWNVGGGLFQLSVIVLILTVGLSMAPSINSASFVFTEYYNGTGFDSTVYVVLINFLFALFTMCGFDATARFSEETHDAHVASPRAIMMTVVSSSIGGFVLIIALLLCIQDIGEAVDSSTGNALAGILVQTMSPLAANICMSAVVTCTFLSGMTTFLVGCRALYAVARDRALPPSRYWAHVDETTKAPIHSNMLFFAICTLLQLLRLTSAGLYVLYSFGGICVASFNLYICIPLVLKLLFAKPDLYVSAPFSLGQWSSTLGWVSTCWLIATMMLMFLPTASPVTSLSMNYAIVFLAGSVLIGSLNWYFLARYSFHGPERYDEHTATISESPGTGDDDDAVWREADDSEHPEGPKPPLETSMGSGGVGHQNGGEQEPLLNNHRRRHAPSVTA